MFDFGLNWSIIYRITYHVSREQIKNTTMSRRVNMLDKPVVSVGFYFIFAYGICSSLLLKGALRVSLFDWKYDICKKYHWIGVWQPQCHWVGTLIHTYIR